MIFYSFEFGRIGARAFLLNGNKFILQTLIIKEMNVQIMN